MEAYTDLLTGCVQAHEHWGLGVRFQHAEIVHYHYYYYYYFFNMLLIWLTGKGRDDLYNACEPY